MVSRLRGIAPLVVDHRAAWCLFYPDVCWIQVAKRRIDDGRVHQRELIRWTVVLEFRVWIFVRRAEGRQYAPSLPNWFVRRRFFFVAFREVVNGELFVQLIASRHSVKNCSGVITTR